jgi:hypothetical protein
MVSMWIALALQAAQSGAASDSGQPPVDLTQLHALLTAPSDCAPSAGPDDIVVCGRTNRVNNQRLEKLDSRFEDLRLPDGRFVRRLSPSSTMEGGGPKGSVGITLRMKFK